MRTLRRTSGWLALALLVLAEEVSFAGQPTGDPSGGAIVGYYSDNRAAILAGNLLWLAAAALLVVGTVGRARGLPLLACRVQSALALAGGAVMVATSVAAVRLALVADRMTGADARTAWRLEGALFTAGFWIWLLVGLTGMVGMREEPWVAVVAGLLLLGALADVAGAGWWLVVAAVATYVAWQPPRAGDPRPEPDGRLAGRGAA